MTNSEYQEQVYTEGGRAVVDSEDLILPPTELTLKREFEAQNKVNVLRGKSKRLPFAEQLVEEL